MFCFKSKSVGYFKFLRYSNLELSHRIVRCFSADTTDRRKIMIDILKNKFPLAKTVEVVDVSGGCGAMYEVLVESTEFKGLSVIKQHRLINDSLKDQIKEMHGLRIFTNIPVQDGSKT